MFELSCVPPCGRLVLLKRRGMFFAATSPVCMCSWQFDPPPPRSEVPLPPWNWKPTSFLQRCCFGLLTSSMQLVLRSFSFRIYIFFFACDHDGMCSSLISGVLFVLCEIVTFAAWFITNWRLKRVRKKKKQFFSRSEWAKLVIEEKKRSNRKSVIVFFGSLFFGLSWLRAAFVSPLFCHLVVIVVCARMLRSLWSLFCLSSLCRVLSCVKTNAGLSSDTFLCC